MEARATSMAISCMWAWMVPHFYIEFTEYRLALTKVSLAKKKEDRQNGNDDCTKHKTARETANNATVKGLSWAIAIIGILYTTTAVVIASLTAQPDQLVLTRGDAIAVGVGRILSAALLAYFSVEVPKWLGISYSSQTNVECYKHVTLMLEDDEPCSDASSNHHQHHRELSFRVCWSIMGYFFIMYPLLLVYFCNESIAHIALSTLVGTFCGFAFVYFMWLGHTKLNHKQRTKLAIFLSVGIAFSSAAAFSAGCWYVKEVWLEYEGDTRDYAILTFFAWFGVCLLIHALLVRLTWRKLAEARVAKEDLQRQRSNDVDTVDASEALTEPEEWRYTSQVFQPPKSINCMATELSKSLPSFRKKERKPLGTPNQDGASEEVKTTITSINVTSQSPQNEGESNEIELRLPRVNSNLSDVETPGVVSTNHPALNDSMATSEDDETIPSEEIVESKASTIWSMIRNNSCCRRRKHYKAPQQKGWSKMATISKWTSWALVCAWHVSFTIVDIGANHERNRIRSALPGTFEMLYPENYNTGAMCAWDEASPSADIRTFDSMQSALDANYTVIHCGECAACSNWNDLSLQWTTRDFLAKKAKKCLTKNLFGTEEDVQKCNQESIGFTEQCSECWTTDQFCARSNCMFLYLQSILTNQLNNFNVGPDDITVATCDEALCGPDFVPCSGATRRRMDIVSGIARPISQQC
eukprot:CAMPEP_0116128384 /NCGR_PEP_ID=MMETSP0329-20121206/7333_1 /TAXON_ID=697910 /ORGANISM="Pseudo-nitzschia arenysensis, Strain B593" /LENGTH=697 /DNA_ID=CAMNT_0003622523 /DNA_START=139 /DNA_END=2229 /DNA_ORIENTATION=+